MYFCMIFILPLFNIGDTVSSVQNRFFFTHSTNIHSALFAGYNFRGWKYKSEECMGSAIKLLTV